MRPPSVADRWTELGSLHEGLDPTGVDAAEEAIVGPYIFMRATRFHRDALRDIARGGIPRIPGGARTLPDGRVAARVMPTGLFDRVSYIGFTADVLMQDGVTLENLPETMAVAYRTPPPGRVCLVLGAGNASSIGPLDVIHKLFVENQVCVLKMHPVMAHLTEVQAAALAPLVREGVVRFVVGDAVQGSYLSSHPGVDTLHITGSDRTYDAIVFGTGPEAAERKRRDEPLVSKPFSAELGNLTPIIVVPGRWSQGDLDFHAENIVTMLTNNAGFNCTTSRVIVTARDWPQRQALLDRIRGRLATMPTRLAYYPGAARRYAAFAEAHPEAEQFGSHADGHLPWMLVPSLSPEATGDPCYRVEAFCSVTAETPIEAPDAATFLERATRFANEELWGTLNATLIVDRRTERERQPGRRAAGDPGPALRHGLGQLLVGGRLRPGHHAVGRLPRQRAHRHRLGHRRRPQPPDVRAAREDDRPRLVPGLAQARVVRQPPHARTCSCASWPSTRPIAGRTASRASSGTRSAADRARQRKRTRGRFRRPRVLARHPRLRTTGWVQRTPAPRPPPGSGGEAGHGRLPDTRESPGVQIHLSRAWPEARTSTSRPD